MWRISWFNVFEFCHAEKWDSRGDLEAKKFFFLKYRGCDNFNDVKIHKWDKRYKGEKDNWGYKRVKFRAYVKDRERDCC